MEDQTFEYAAFVSYRHTEPDKTWAKWLVDTLETYKIPKALRERGYPNKIGKLYRDEDEAHAGAVLGDHIATALDQSRTLIIVCTPNTQDSPWVEREIEYFRLLGRGDRIFCLLADGEPETSFPKPLLQQTKDRADALAGPSAQQSVAADVRPTEDKKAKAQERDAALRLISGVLGCKFDDLKRRDEERERKRKQRNWAAAVAAFLAVALFGGWYWDQSRVKTRYYANVSTEFGVPAGAYQINEETYSARAVAYEFQYTWGKVRRVIRKGDPDWDYITQEPYSIEAETSWEVSYDEDGNLAELVAFDVAGETLRRYLIDFQARTKRANISFVSASGNAISNAPPDRSLRKHTGSPPTTKITRYELTFDELGQTQTLRFANQHGDPQMDGNQVYGYRYEYHADGLISERTRLNASGNPISEPGFAVVDRFTYDDGLITSRSFYDLDGNRTNGGRNYSYLMMTRNTAGNIEVDQYFGADEKPILRNGGFHKLVSEYDVSGNRVAIRYFGLVGPVSHRSEYNYHSATFSFEDGKLIEERYFDENEELFVVRDGFAVLKRQNDPHGRAVSFAYFDDNLRPILDADGHHIWEIDRDHRGRVTRSVFRGVDRERILGNEKYPYTDVITSYDDAERTRKRCYFIADTAALHPEGFHCRVTQYDVFQRTEANEFLDLEENPCNCRNGYFRQVLAYDAAGNWTTSTFYGTDGNPIQHRDGHHIWKATYDHRGLLLREETLGLDGSTLTPRRGTSVAITIHTYDAIGRKISTGYFSSPGRPTTHKARGYHRREFFYDDPDPNISWSAIDYDTNGRTISQ